MMVSVILLLGLTIIFMLFRLKHGSSGKTRFPPGPPGIPIIGNLHQLDCSAPPRYLWQLSKKYGPLMSLRLGFRPTIVVSLANMAREVMKVRDVKFSGRPYLVAQQKLSYNGLDLAFAPYNDYWREMRKVCVLHLFSSKRAQSFNYIREDEVSLMVKHFSKSASESKVINLTETLMALTSTIIRRIALGQKYEDQCHEQTRFHSLLYEAEAMLGSFFVTDYFPFVGWVDYVNGLRGRLDKILKEMDLFYQEIINDHLDPNRSKPDQEDLIDVLLRLKAERLLAHDLTWDHIKAVLMDVFVAGSDTSAAVTVWAMTELMKNNEVMKKVQEEVRNVIGEKGFVNEEDIPKLHYLKAVIKETMRLHPASPLLVPCETVQSCSIGEYHIPKKTLVYVNAWAIGRDPEAWENPEEFMPERFVGSSIDFNGQDFGLIPFGAGRRGCPGIYMGTLNVELALANILYAFEWELPPGMEKEDIDFDVIPGITMHKKTALSLVATNFLKFE